MDISGGAFIIGWDFNKDDSKHERDTLVVMQGGQGVQMKVINAFYDKEAHDIFNLLTKKKEDK